MFNLVPLFLGGWVVVEDGKLEQHVGTSPWRTHDLTLGGSRLDFKNTVNTSLPITR